MKALLGDESDAFFAELEKPEPAKAFRVNPIKLTEERFEEIAPEIDREKAIFPRECYRTAEEHPGSLACHHSGMIYVQDPSAMATVNALEVRAGWRVLDSCSAPGGKTAQLSAAVGDGGVVVANEYEGKRCRILSSNLERLGSKNTVILNLDTAVIAEEYPDLFDLVLCDAPCSGEGMFRKNARAVEEWSAENVKLCAERQREILFNVALCVRGGGYLLYSTCTFSLEENEYNVEAFLNAHKDFELCPVSRELADATSDGIIFDGAEHDMTLTRRFYPHICRGEGQFIALMRRRGELADEAQGIADDRADATAQSSYTDRANDPANAPDRNQTDGLADGTFDGSNARNAYTDRADATAQSSKWERVSGSSSRARDDRRGGKAQGGGAKNRVSDCAKNRASDGAKNRASDGKGDRQGAAEIAAAKEFLTENLTELPQAELFYHKGYVYLKPQIALPREGVFTPGVCVGELQGARFVPHHRLFSAYGDRFARRIDLKYGSSELDSYLCGNEISTDALSVAEGSPSDGFCAVLVDGVPLGGGKISAGRCKNHYPKGLRN